MKKKQLRGMLYGIGALLAIGTVSTQEAVAQAAGGIGPTFSVDYQGPSAGFVPGPLTGVPDGWGISMIDEGSILTTTPPGVPGPNPALPGPLPAPGIMVGANPGALGSIPGGLGLLGGVPIAPPVELDALSYGRDIVNPGSTAAVVRDAYFSVDEFAVGIPGASPAPDVTSEGATGAGEASADVFRYLGPYPPAAVGPVFGNVDVLDGNGMAPFGGPGTGLIEPNPPTVGNAQDPGDNLDAVDMNSTYNDVAGLIYFSLDGESFDFLEIPLGGGPPPNTATALVNGFNPGDVLMTTPGGVPSVFAFATTLGLDLTLAGPGSDDLDALALQDNGDGVPLVGEPGSGLDEILFSVRRGSAVISAPDSKYGMPIEEGDILTVPLPTVMGGVSPFPQIFIPAEALGLATVRSGFGTSYGVVNPTYGTDTWADDLDALDVVPEPTGVTLMLLGLMGLGCRRKRC